MQHADFVHDNGVYAGRHTSVRNVPDSEGSCSSEPGIFKTPSRQPTSKIIARATGPYIPIIAGNCRSSCPSTTRTRWVGREPVELRGQGSSNIVGASNLLHLHRAAAMAAAIVTSVPR